MFSVHNFYEKHSKSLLLELVSGDLSKEIKKPVIYRPFLEYVESKVSSILIFGSIEMKYLATLTPEMRVSCLDRVLTTEIPFIIVAKNFPTPKEMETICVKKRIPLFRTKMDTMRVINRIILILTDELAPSTTLHGTFVEVFGIGVLMQGESSVGKSEAALGLINRGHRLISDDVVHVKKRGDNDSLVGTGPEMTKNLMEIRGIGIINVVHLYGESCVCREKEIDLIVKLEEWNHNHFYDRTGLKEEYIDILGIRVPYRLLPVKIGRDVALLMETISLNYRLKREGCNSVKKFSEKLAKVIAYKDKKHLCKDV